MADATFVECGGTGAPRGRRREVVVAGKRLKTVDVHARCAVPAAMVLMGRTLETEALLMSSSEERLRAMAAQDIDVDALSINPYWCTADRDVPTALIRIQNETRAEICAGIGSWGGCCPSLVDYVAVTGPRTGRPPAGGVDVAATADPWGRPSAAAGHD